MNDKPDSVVPENDHNVAYEVLVGSSLSKLTEAWHEREIDSKDFAVGAWCLHILHGRTKTEICPGEIALYALGKDDRVEYLWGDYRRGLASLFKLKHEGIIEWRGGANDEPGVLAFPADLLDSVKQAGK